jgi:hypothetical protein
MGGVDGKALAIPRAVPAFGRVLLLIDAATGPGYYSAGLRLVLPGRAARRPPQSFLGIVR